LLSNLHTLKKFSVYSKKQFKENQDLVTKAKGLLASVEQTKRAYFSLFDSETEGKEYLIKHFKNSKKFSSVTILESGILFDKITAQRLYDAIESELPMESISEFPAKEWQLKEIKESELKNLSLLLNKIYNIDPSNRFLYMTALTARSRFVENATGFEDMEKISIFEKSEDFQKYQQINISKEEAFLLSHYYLPLTRSWLYSGAYPRQVVIKDYILANTKYGRSEEKLENVGAFQQQKFGEFFEDIVVAYGLTQELIDSVELLDTLDVEKLFLEKNGGVFGIDWTTVPENRKKLVTDTLKLLIKNAAIIHLDRIEDISEAVEKLGELKRIQISILDLSEYRKDPKSLKRSKYDPMKLLEVIKKESLRK
jgi:hypothetical protein